MANEVPLRHWFGKQIALPNLTADRLQLVAFMTCFDALGHRSETEPAPQLNNGLAQTGICLLYTSDAADD